LIRLLGKFYGAHRIVWVCCYGKWPTHEIDHRNNNPLDNRIENLREATHAENQRNKPPMSNNRLGVKGVCYDPKRKRYRAQIKVDGKVRQIGRFKTLAEADAAYRAAATIAHGEFFYSP
jgi:hypothetical protein